MKDTILSEKDLEEVIVFLSNEIVERNSGVSKLAVVGIRTRGAYLAQRIVSIIKGKRGNYVPLGILDITLYRDDLTTIAHQPVVHSSKIDFDITDKRIILVDDVLYTGRTVRCALDELVDFGRPQNIQLVVLIDRGHRELPIQADYVGKRIFTTKNQVVRVRLKEIDGVDGVFIEGKR